MRGLASRLYSWRTFTDKGQVNGYPDRLNLLVQEERRRQEEIERETSDTIEQDNQASPDDPHSEEVSLAKDGESVSQQHDSPDAWLEHEPIVNSGYIFNYALTDPGQPGNFALTASPLEYGKTGTLSFFIDATCVLRSTSENREARKDDPAASWDNSPRGVR
jgi:hypothetical protein